MPKPSLCAGDRPEGARTARWSRRALLVGSLQALGALAACMPVTEGGGRAPAPPSPSAGPAAGAVLAATPAGTGVARSCVLPPVVAPTPIPYPGYTQEEPSTGLHVTGPARVVELAAYRLALTGKIDRPLSLAYDEVRCLPKVGASARLVCPGFFADQSNLAGATLASVLGLASLQPGATRVRLTSVDGYATDFSLEETRAEQNFLAYEWEGEPLPASHGFPLRAVIPSAAGSRWVKWVVGIEVI